MNKVDKSTRKGSSASGGILHQAQPQTSTSKVGSPKGRGSKKRGGSAETQPVVRRSMISLDGCSTSTTAW